tara:strand:- start:250 stop:456 length:207 start_codon:yes stop_codon:yes gene_type:complete
MAVIKKKYEKSKYKYVDKEISYDKVCWRRIAMMGYGTARYKTEREAALSADKILIQNNKEPVNILVRK